MSTFVPDMETHIRVGIITEVGTRWYAVEREHFPGWVFLDTHTDTFVELSATSTHLSPYMDRPDDLPLVPHSKLHRREPRGVDMEVARLYDHETFRRMHSSS